MNTPTTYCSSCGVANSSEATYCLSCGRVLQKNVQEATYTIDDTGRLPVQQHLHGRYKIVGLLGKGGMGAVYKAEDTQFGNRFVGVKEMSQNNLPPQVAVEAADQFKQEAHLLASLKHPNLPSIYDYFTENGRWYLVMDFIEGITLEQHISNIPSNILSVSEALNIGIQLARVLGYLHTRPTPIVFRDLKPLNVMITPDDNIYLIDFGIARLFKQGQVKDTVAYVSAGYAAPEQFGNAQTTPQSDIYSLGVMLHQLLSGSNPLTNTSMFNFQSLQAYNSALPSALKNLVAQMLTINPLARPQNMTIVRQELERIQQAQQRPITPLPPPPPIHFSSSVPPTQAVPQPLYFPSSMPPTQAVSPPASPSASKNLNLLLPLSILGIILLAGVVMVGVLLSNRSPIPSNKSSVTFNSGGSTSSSTATSGTNTLSTSTVTPVTTSIPYPSYSDAQTDIIYYYENESDFQGKNVIQSFDSLTYQAQVGPPDQPQFVACSEYKYASVSSPDVTAGTARHTFNFQYSNGTWKVVDMGNWNSC